MESVKLNRENLKRVGGNVKVPVYSKEDMRPSIVHIGLGNFHRAHQAAYLDELLNAGKSREGIFEINMIPDSFPLAGILEAQDYLYTLITKNPKGEADVRVVSSIMGYINAASGKEAALARAARPETGIISLTVTEGGYYYNKETREPDAGEAAVKWDLENSDNPKTAAGFLAAVLARRYREGKKPLTIMCCDNVPQNGKVLESCVLFFCREHHREILSWVNENVSFPSSMVDRITPGTTPALIKELETSYGISDLWPVCGEDFRQWVLEDNFRTPVPDYAARGVQLVKDVEPYELMKMRLLNGSHSALSYPGYLLGFRLVDECIADPLMARFIRGHYMEEVTPTLEAVPGMDLTQYKDILISRFSNKNISDTILRLCSQGTAKIPNFMMNPLADTVRKGLPNQAICFALASWARFLTGKDEQGKDIPLEDANGPAISAAARKAQSEPASFLTEAGLRNLSAAQISEVSGTFKKHLDNICRKGIKAALEEFSGK